ncbi:MAG: T9SS type A sorting domain-containing protein [Candidatus Eisenbacteria bacterium]|uniref:T9SS type A sorting domain-containing protein n=1 Tax=Eiseniibacteriota bacterium TaxID=2212470 RepID=A0A538TQI2_UNCEI|nr:MAG: T9SS type A sorting domain-containing protein [Candidatus Eisenbacteria bacterium]
MTSGLKSFLVGLAFAMLGSSVASAGSFTVNVSPSVSNGGWTGSTFVASNPTPVPVVQSLPTCNYTVSCDRVTVTVSDITQAYLDLHPDHRVIFRIDWPDENADFDMYVMNSADNTRLTASASGDRPEIATLPLALGTTTYVLRIVPYTVVPLDSYTGTIALASPSAPPPPGGFGIGAYAVGTDVFSCNAHLTGVDENGTDHAFDAEPGVKFDPLGNAYVVSNSGAGLGIWRVTDLCGQRYQFLGIDLLNGGGDGDVETASELNANGFYNIYTSSLHSLDALVNLNSSVSYDGGNSFLTTPVSDATPLNDRQWNAAYGKDIVLLSYRSANTGNQQFCMRARATEGVPLVFGPSSPVYTDPGTIGALISQSGTMVCDQRPGAVTTDPAPHAAANGAGSVYHAFNINGDHVWLGISRDFGTTWHDALVFQGAPGSSYDHIFTWCAVDRAGNVYVSFSDDHDVYYCVSSDIQTSDSPTWSKPIRVNDGPETKTAALPSVAAGSAGRIVFTWYGSPTLTPHETDAQWRVFHARCDNALDALNGGVPLFEQALVSDHVVHTGDLCEGGTLGCPVAGSRDLLDDFEIDVSPIDGTSFITYTDDAAGQATFISRQLAGKSALAGMTVTDRTGVCPAAVASCVPPPPPPPPVNGDPCTLPGVLVIPDRVGDEVPPNPQQDIQEVRIAEPLVNGKRDSLYFTFKVGSLDPDNLPPNAFWRVIWNSFTWYVQATKCATASGMRYSYGTFGTGSVELGLADGGSVSPDGTIQIIVAKSKVGNPQPGQQLTAVNADARTVAGNCPGSPAAFAPVDTTGNGTYTMATCGTVAVDPWKSPGLSLALAGANPFKGRTLLTYSLPRRLPVRVEVFGVTGQRVARLAEGVQGPGTYTVALESNLRGRSLGPGIYMVRMTAGKEERHLRVVAIQ